MIARALYTGLLYLIAPLAFVWMALRARRQTGAPDALRERCGYVPTVPVGESSLWVHAASLGEVKAAQGLIDALLARDCPGPLVITTFSATARQYCIARFGDRATVAALPYDVPLFVARFLRATRPAAAIFVETEIWPTIYHALYRRKTPLCIVSARLSARAFRHYWFLRRLMTPCLERATLIASQTRADADRFLALGAPAGCVSVSGNIKFDTRLASTLIERGKALRHRLFGARFVWVAGSTREGEDAAILTAFAALREAAPDAVLVLAPRHPERAHFLAKQVEAAGCSAELYSRHQGIMMRDVLIIDSVGLLLDFYVGADVVFVGGSLVADVGGHNILEPAMLGRPVVTGPHLDNWRALAHEMQQTGAMAMVPDADALGRKLIQWQADSAQRRRVGAAAQRCVEGNRGALARVLTAIDAVVGTGATPRLESSGLNND